MKKLPDEPYYVFVLYISGMNIHSLNAVKNLRKICETHLPGRYEIKVVDQLKDSEKILHNEIMVFPTVVKVLPSPERKLVGDLSNTAQVLINLGIK
ncbi:MAG: hypothetical protein BGO14_05145 [Chlamydiales bacterium 38-26]|mgnify:CR=1 FL=1|nr:hypothetical protein [Chlamydiales bacterium]OJV07861.1 MAG: hypothetical protein BGO14_05145 [Chlamydiales bacterium 38-26]